MPFSESNRVRLSYIAETVFGTTPATPTMQKIRFTSSDMAGNKQTALSDEIRSDRMVSSMAEVGFDSNASIGFDMSLGGSFDDFLEAVLCGTAAAGVITNGTVKRSFTMESSFEDIGVHQVVKGMRVGTFQLDINANSIVSGSFGFMGTELALSGSEAGSVYTAQTSTEVVNATTNVGSIEIDDVAIAVSLQAISLNIDNGLRLQPAIGSKYPVGIGYGRQVISGSITAYFEDTTLYQAMLDHDDIKLEFTLSDAAGNSIAFELPRIKFSSDAPSPGGIDQDVMETLEWTALADATGTYQIKVTITNV